MSFMAVDPSTGHEFAELPETAVEDIPDLVEDARRALAVETDWRTPFVRARALLELARQVEAEADNLADFETRDTGKPLKQAQADVRATIRYLEYYAGSIERIEGRSIPLGPAALDYTVREPWGVCGQIIPWNYPLQVAVRCAAPALAAGNAVILKPSELASITPLRLGDLAEQAGVPRGMFQIVLGGADVGAELVEHVDHVTFVGSAAVGAKVAEAGARRLKPVQLELGGKSPNVVFADADIEKAVPAIVSSLLQNAGQSCSAGSRLLIDHAIYDDVIELVGEALDGVSIGPGIEDRDLGPLISVRQLRRATSMLQTAETAGAHVLGGERLEGLFMRPALVMNVTPDMEIFQEEVFGPVLVAAGFNGEREAIELANATAYGLVAGVWTKDLARAHRVAAGIRAGQVFVNGYGVGGGVELPFGGMGRSGYGRGKGVEALLAYTQIKNVWVALDG